VGTAIPRVANLLLGLEPARVLMKRVLGVSVDAPLPPFTRHRFDRWFRRRSGSAPGSRGRVLLWDDTWTRYHEARIGRAAVTVLETVGFEVALVEGRRCCGRPAASRGLLAELRRLGEHNLQLLVGGSEPIVFLEPSCYSVFIDEYRQLGLHGAEDVAGRCVLVEDLLLDVMDGQASEELPWSSQVLKVAVHGHCHTKALAGPTGAASLLGRIPGATVLPLETGCCGMAGAFGMLEANRELSRAVADPLIQSVRALSPGTLVAAAGTSCRHQIQSLAGIDALHPVEVFARALRPV
jgi:Fe-S oxidoreductase